MISRRHKIMLAILGLSLGAAGCELLVDFDRTKIDGGGLDGSPDVTVDVQQNDQKTNDSPNDVVDDTTTTDASDGGTGSDASDSSVADSNDGSSTTDSSSSDAADD